jgi:superfamily II DNA or RNA helicase
MIINIVSLFPDRVFLILCKRVEQGRDIVRLLENIGEDVTSLIGKQQEYKESSRILVGTSSKAGTGFDHPRLDALILASDIQAYFIQYLGRVLRTQTVIPLIFDIVDKNSILEKHWRTRYRIYKKHGGIVKNMKREFPEFEIV